MSETLIETKTMTKTETITLDNGTEVTFTDNGEVFTCSFFPGMSLARWVSKEVWESWNYLFKVEILLLCMECTFRGGKDV